TSPTDSPAMLLDMMASFGTISASNHVLPWLPEDLMPDQGTVPEPMPSGLAPETYSHRANPAFDAAMTRRTSASDAAFFLPHLQPGMRLLDIGCGPGSITLGLAEAVAPGDVIGLDLRPEVVAAAAALAQQRGVTTVRFQVGDVYALPFPDAAFDAVFACQVLL